MRTEEASDRSSAPAAPIRLGERIGALDALRGLALCGIIFINIPQTLGMFAHAGELPEGLRWFVFGRFYPIFYTLFGVGFGIFLRSAARRVSSPRRLLLRRFLALAVIGGLLHLIQPGEVLLPFAIAGVVVLLPLSYLRPPMVLAIGCALTVTGIAAGVGGFGLLPGLFALGFAMAGIGVPAALHRYNGRLAVFGVVALAVALLTLWLVLSDLPNIAQIRLGTTLSLAISAFYTALFLLLLRTPLGDAFAWLLAPMGRMALTNYVSQAVLFVSIGSAFSLRGSSEWTTTMLLGAGILLIQAIWSRLWLQRFTYGPLEWIWRCVTYWHYLPLGQPRSKAIDD